MIFKIGLEIAGILIAVSLIMSLIEYRAETNADLKSLDDRERELMLRHLKEVNKKP